VSLSRPIRFPIYISWTGGEEKLPSRVATAFFHARAVMLLIFSALLVPPASYWSSHQHLERGGAPFLAPVVKQPSCSGRSWFSILRHLRLQVLKQQHPVLKLQQSQVHPQPTEVLGCLLCLPLSFADL
jgi:hypothetical protein